MKATLPPLWPASTTRRPVHILLWIALAGYLWILPVGETIALRNLFFVVMLLCFIVLQRNRWRHLDFLLWRQWTVYATVITLSLCYAIDITYSLGEMRAELLYPLLLFWLGLNIVRSHEAYSRLIAILAMGNLFLVTYSLVTTALGETTKDGLVGTLNTGVGTYSTYLITVMPIIALLSWQAWTNRENRLALSMGALLLAGLASLYFTLNRQGFLVLVVEIGVITLLNIFRNASWAKFVALIAATMLALALFFLVSAQKAPAPETSVKTGMDSVGQSVKTDVRWRLWQFSLDEIVKSPMTGGGFGQRTFKLRFPDFEPESVLWHAHNMLLNKGVQMGVPGMLAFLLLFFSVPWTLRKGLRNDPASRRIASVGIAIALGVFLKNMTDDFFTRDCGYLYWIIIGATLGCIREKMTNTKESA